MPSAIDVTKPIYGSPTTQSVRDNFTFAHDEISSLQSDVNNRVLKSGDIMTGLLSLSGDPTLAMHAANRSWVINQIRSTANAMIYVGDYDAAADRVLSSGQASIAVGSPLPVAGTANSQFYFTVKVGNATSIGNQPPGGVPVGSWLISNGIIWNVYQPSAAGVTAQTVPVVPAIVGLPGATVYNALSSVPALFLPLLGGRLGGDLTLFQNPTLDGHAATKAYVDAKPPGGVTSFNTRTGAIVLQQSDMVSVGVLNDVGRNLIHNSMFNVAQRGGGPFSANFAYTVDRWTIQVVSDTISVTQQTFTDAGRAAVGDEAAVYQVSNIFTGNAAAGAFNFLTQWIENVRRLGGKTVTVSFWAATPVGTLKLGVSIDQWFGTPGGGGSAQVNGNGQVVTINTVWTRYKLIFAVASTSGKLLSSSLSDATGLNFWFSSGTTNAIRSGNVGVQSGTVLLWGVQLEIGSVATSLENIDLQQDLAKCQRFYRNPVSCSLRANVPTGGGTFDCTVSWPYMRAIPTAVLMTLGTVSANSASSSLIPITNSEGRFGVNFNAGGDSYTLGQSFSLSADL